MTKVSLFVPCLVDQFLPEIGEATARLLIGLGARVDYDARQTCCGQPLVNAGRTEEAKRAALRFLDIMEGGGYVVAPSGSCVHTVKKHYPDLLFGTRDYERAVNLAARTYELSDFLVNVMKAADKKGSLGPAANAAGSPPKITYHHSCHIIRGLGISQEPRLLLGSLTGVEVVPLMNEDVCCGFGGEFSALTMEEKKRLMGLTVKEAAGRVFVMPNVGAITTAESVALARHAEAVGCDAVSAVTPFFLKPSQEELFEHYRAICAAVEIPVLAYNIPERTGGVALNVATVSRLAREVPNFAGIKDSTGDLTTAAEIVRVSPPGFRVFMGRDTLIFGALLYGCAGAVAATANVAPGLAVGIHDAVMAGDLPKAKQLQDKLAPVRRLFTIGSHPLGLKEAMVQLGTIECGRCRRPTLDITPAQKNEVTAVLREAGLR